MANFAAPLPPPRWLPRYLNEAHLPFTQHARRLLLLGRSSSAYKLRSRYVPSWRRSDTGHKLL